LRQTLEVFEPNKLVSKNVMRILIGAQLAILLLFWGISSTLFFPTPGQILSALSYLWLQQGLGSELVVSFMLNLEALTIATVLSLLLAYASVIPFFRPIVSVLGKLRFLSLIGLSFFFTMWASNGHQLKVSLLVFGVSVFFVTSMADVVASVPKEDFDLARTLRMGEPRVVWEVVILGKIDQAFDVLRQNAAMSWMLLSLVETVSREGGGIGALLVDENKHFHLAQVMAIQFCILTIGIFQDFCIGAFKQIVCPYSALTLERK
jgi:NitT/TauT family transport system permease protein